MSPALLRPWARPRVLLAGWLLLVLAVVTGSLLPSAALPAPSFPGIDKLQHLSAYALLSGYAVLLFASARVRMSAALALVALGIALEGAQGMLTASRLADAWDVLANSIGVVLGYWLGHRAAARCAPADPRG